MAHEIITRETCDMWRKVSPGRPPCTALHSDAPAAYQCLTCPFVTSDPDAMRGHETYLDTHPAGWLGHGERHAMAVWREGSDRLPWGVTGPTGWADANSGPRPASMGPRPATVVDQTAQPMRCRSIYPGAAMLSGQPIRCDDRTGHDGIHGHSFAARYWFDDGVTFVR